ncbi:YlxR family protein [bacterium]|nr:YlxR family protein [bacterium]
MVERRCVGCGQIKNTDELMKITKNYLTGKVEINENSKIFGRSAYLCYNEKCIEMAFKKNRLNKSLKSSEDLKGLLDGRKY